MPELLPPIVPRDNPAALEAALGNESRSRQQRLVDGADLLFNLTPQELHRGSASPTAFHNNNNNNNNSSHASALASGYSESQSSYTDVWGRKREKAAKPLAATPSLRCLIILRRFLESLSAEDFGLTEEVIRHNASRATAHGNRTLVAWTLRSTPYYTIDCFLLPKSCPLALHDHIGMIVLMKVLSGDLRARVVTRLAGDEEEDLEDWNSDVREEERLNSVNSVPIHLGSPTDLRGSSALTRMTSLALSMALGSRTAIFDPPRMDEIRPAVVNFDGTVTSGGSHSDDPESDVRPEEPMSRLSLGVDEEQGWRSTMLCLPFIGNIHRVAAKDDHVLFVDVISPPYARNVDCHYFVELGNDRANRFKGPIEVTRLMRRPSMQIGPLDSLPLLTS